jgi:hypothetical protein
MLVTTLSSEMHQANPGLREGDIVWGVNSWRTPTKEVFDAVVQHTLQQGQPIFVYVLGRPDAVPLTPVAGHVVGEGRTVELRIP